MTLVFVLFCVLLFWICTFWSVASCRVITGPAEGRFKGRETSGAPIPDLLASSLIVEEILVGPLIVWNKDYISQLLLQQVWSCDQIPVNET